MIWILILEFKSEALRCPTLLDGYHRPDHRGLAREAKRLLPTEKEELSKVPGGDIVRVVL